MRNYLFASLFLLSPLLGNIAVFSKLSLGDIAVFAIFLPYVLLKTWGNATSVLGAFMLTAIFIFIEAFYIFYFNMGIFAAARMYFYILVTFVFLRLYKHHEVGVLVGAGYLKLATLCSLLLIIQIIIYHSTGIVYTYIETPFDVEANSVRTGDLLNAGFRSGGVFKEPSYYAMFMIPALFYSAAARRYVMWAFFTCSVLSSTSALGFVFIGLSMLQFSGKRKLPLIGLASAVVILFLGALSLNMLPERVTSTIYGQGSMSVRVLTPLKTVFVDVENIIEPNTEVLSALADPELAKNLWFNSISYAVVLFGIFILVPLGLLLYGCGRKVWLVALLLMLTANPLTGSYLLVIVIVMKILLNESFERSRLIKKRRRIMTIQPPELYNSSRCASL